MKIFSVLYSIPIILLVISCEKEETADPIKTSMTITNVSIYGTSDGAVDLLVEGGVQSYTFIWSNGESTEDLENIPAGNYYVTVTDNEGETKLDTAMISEPDELNMEAEITDVSTSGGDNGQIGITVSGGVEPYSFNWSDGSTKIISQPIDIIKHFMCWHPFL